MLELGVPVGAGTDATRVASYNPWVCLYWLSTGKTEQPQHRSVLRKSHLDMPYGVEWQYRPPTHQYVQYR
jgi:predicted amidohydrolase YtcJ